MLSVARERIAPAIDHLSFALAVVAMIQVVILVATMLYEVVARYGFDRPTLWSGDIVYMMNGTLFLLGAAWTLRRNQHVRIDFLSSRLPLRAQHGLNLAFYLLLFLPVLGLVGYATIVKAWVAYRDGELEQMSAWEPKIWPFYAGLAIGLVALALQVIAEAIQHAVGIADPSAVPSPSATEETHAV
jgi:TRAP-type mannitol/chloroaromatic compound transport system permease small subunit